MPTLGEGSFGKVVAPDDLDWKDYDVYYVTTGRGGKKCAHELESRLLPHALGCSPPVSGEYRNDRDVIIKMLNPADTILPRELVGAMYVMRCVGDDPEHLSILARQTMDDVSSTTALWCLKKLKPKQGESEYGLVFRKMKGDVLDLDWGLEENAAIVPRTLAMVELLQQHGYVHGDIKPENIMYVDDDDGNREFALGDYGSVTTWSVYSKDNYGIYTSTFVSPLYLKRIIVDPLVLWDFVGCAETWVNMVYRPVAYTSCWWTWDFHSTGASIADYLYRRRFQRRRPPLTDTLLRAARVLFAAGEYLGNYPLSPMAHRMALLRTKCPELRWPQPPTVHARPQPQQPQPQQPQQPQQQQPQQPQQQQPQQHQGVVVSTAAQAAKVIADKMKWLGLTTRDWLTRRKGAVAPTPDAAPTAPNPPTRIQAWGDPAHANAGEYNNPLYGRGGGARPGHADVGAPPAHEDVGAPPAYVAHVDVVLCPRPAHAQPADVLLGHHVEELLGHHKRYFEKWSVARRHRGGHKKAWPVTHEELGLGHVDEELESDDEDEDEDEDEDDEIEIGFASSVEANRYRESLLGESNKITNIDDAEAVAAATNDDHEFELAAFAMWLMSQPGSTLGFDYWNMLAEYFALRVSTSLVFDGLPVSDDSKAAFVAVCEMHRTIHANLFDRHRGRDSDPSPRGGAQPRSRAVRAQSKTPAPKQRTTRSATAKAAATKATAAATKAKAAAKSTGRPNGRKPPAATRRGI
jgi:pyruvate/2-oxoglutarate dehydrogenase complex dihydrolipoamide acyltransferase (E2) component